jgi:hypothetical protein
MKCGFYPLIMSFFGLLVNVDFVNSSRSVTLPVGQSLSYSATIPVTQLLSQSLNHSVTLPPGEAGWAACDSD